MDKNDDEKKGGDKLYSKLEDVDNKLERIKSDTHNLSRIASLQNAPLIRQELKKAIGRSEVRAAILHLTKSEIKASELAIKVGIAPNHLAVFMAPFLGNAGYIAAIRRGRERYFQRSELVDLVGFESEKEFAVLLSAWEAKRKEETVTSVNGSNESTNAD